MLLLNFIFFIAESTTKRNSASTPPVSVSQGYSGRQATSDIFAPQGVKTTHLFMYTYFNKHKTWTNTYINYFIIIIFKGKAPSFLVIWSLYYIGDSGVTTRNIVITHGPSNENLFPSHWNCSGANIAEIWHISKPEKIKPNISAWLDTTWGDWVNI